MNKKRRLLTVLLTVALLVSQMTFVSLAAGSSNIYATVDNATPKVGETFTVTLYNKAMSVGFFSAGIAFNKNVVECVDIFGCIDGEKEPYLTKTNGGYTALGYGLNQDSKDKIGCYYSATKNTSYAEAPFIAVTFKAIKSGSAGITLFEDSDGDNVFSGTNMSPGFSVDIGSDDSSDDDKVDPAKPDKPVDPANPVKPVKPDDPNKPVNLVIPDDNTQLINKVKSVKVTSAKATAKATGKITVTWKKLKTVDVDKYIVYRSTKKNSGFKKVGSVSATMKTYTDAKNLKKGKKYYYKVRGYVKIDNKNVYTKYSAVTKYAKCKKTIK